MNTVTLLLHSFRATYHLNRYISTSAILNSCRTFQKFTLIYRGTEKEKQQQRENPDRNVPLWSHGLRHPGYFVGNRFVLIPEMVPDLIVPDLTDCQLLPYVSYRVASIKQDEFNHEDLFNAIYAPKIEKDLNSGLLDEDGNPSEPSDDEKMTAEEAYNKARQTGSDYFCQDRPPSRAERLNIS